MMLRQAPQPVAAPVPWRLHRLGPARWRLSRQMRRRLRYAESLERAVDRAHRPRGLSAAIPVSPEAWGAAQGPMLDLAERLRQPRPVAPAGLARVRTLLTDGAGPLYCGPPGELHVAARNALDALEGRR
jgi:hypothetical protein